MPDYDWNAIRTEYVTTKIGLRELAKKYGVGTTALGLHCREEGWVAQRAAHRDTVVKKAVRKSEAKEVNRLARLMTATTKALDVAMEAFEDSDQFNRYIVQRREKYMGGRDAAQGDVIEREWSEEQTFNKIDTRALKDLTGILKDLDSLLRNYYNIPTPAQAEAQRIAAERLELDKRKAEAAIDEDDDESGVILIPDTDG